MFINEFVTSLWQTKSGEFQTAYQEALLLDAETIYQRLSQTQMTIHASQKYNINALITCGCKHHIRNGNLSGCSMCNFHGIQGNLAAMMKALREKDRSLYAKIVSESFINTRGIIDYQTGSESILGFDLLCDREFPDEVYHELFGAEGPFKIRPYRFNFEARADSVTREKLEVLKKVSGKGKAVIGLGVEIGNEWLRNHWINKANTDQQIEDAIKMIREAGFKVCVNTLIGIPGLTERQSIELLVDGVKWLSKFDFDELTISATTRFETTLQGYLHEHLKYNKRLEDIGIAQGEHTGITWLFTFVEAMAQVLQLVPKKKILLAQFSAAENFMKRSYPYNESMLCGCMEETADAVVEMAVSKNPEKLLLIREKMKEDPCYSAYTALLKKQEKAGTVQETLQIVGEELAKSMWPELWEEKVSQLTKELATFYWEEQHEESSEPVLNQAV